MKLLVTGATGYIGQALCEKLKGARVEIHALSRSPDKAQFVETDGLQIFKGDIQNSKVLRKAMQGCDRIFHLAAYTKIWSKDQSIYERVNVDATKLLLDLALDNGIRRVVLTSTGGTMGPAMHDGKPVNEKSNGEVRPESLYDASKIREEREALQYVEKGLEVVVVNPTRIYGPGPVGQSNSVTNMISLFRKGKWRIIPADGESLGNYVFIDDVVDGHLLAMKNGRSGERYILGGSNLSYNELFALLRQLTGSHHRLFHVPLGMVLAFAHLQKIAADYFGIEPSVVPEFARKLSRHWNMSSDKAVRDLGYQITPIKDGLMRTLEWLSHE